MYKGLNEMNMEELICTDGGGVGWLAVAGAVVTIGTLVSIIRCFNKLAGG